MKKRSKNKYRISVDCSDRAVMRLSVRERSRNGEFAAIERPWGQKDIAAFKKAAKAVALLAQGISDLDEIRRTASAARGPRRLKTPLKDALGEDQNIAPTVSVAATL
ncbi:MAG: hypothetical protein WBB34_17680 [Xanthobacteraceae bacterium]